MSGYAMAAAGVAEMMTGAQADAAYEAAYGKYYSAAMNMRNAGNAKVAAEANIAAIKQDKIHTDVMISANQEKAEAQAKVMSAVSGVEGQSVEATIYQSEINSSLAKANNKRVMQQNIEQQLAAVYSSQSAMLAADNPSVQKISLTDNLVQAGLGLVGTEMGGKLVDGMGDLFKPAQSGPSTIDGAYNYQLEANPWDSGYDSVTRLT